MKRVVEHTLSIQEVADGDVMGLASFGLDGGVLEHLVDMAAGAQPHILLTESLDMLVDVCVLLFACELHRSPFGVLPGARVAMTYKLIRKRHLLQLHLVNAGLSGRRKARKQQCVLHDSLDRCGDDGA